MVSSKDPQLENNNSEYTGRNKSKAGHKTKAEKQKPNVDKCRFKTKTKTFPKLYMATIYYVSAKDKT